MTESRKNQKRVTFASPGSGGPLVGSPTASQIGERPKLGTIGYKAKLEAWQLRNTQHNASVSDPYHSSQPASTQKRTFSSSSDSRNEENNYIPDDQVARRQQDSDSQTATKYSVVVETVSVENPFPVGAKRLRISLNEDNQLTLHWRDEGKYFSDRLKTPESSDVTVTGSSPKGSDSLETSVWRSSGVPRARSAATQELPVDPNGPRVFYSMGVDSDLDSDFGDDSDAGPNTQTASLQSGRFFSSGVNQPGTNGMVGSYNRFKLPSNRQELVAVGKQEVARTTSGKTKWIAYAEVIPLSYLQPKIQLELPLYQHGNENNDDSQETQSQSAKQSRLSFIQPLEGFCQIFGKHEGVIQAIYNPRRSASPSQPNPVQPAPNDDVAIHIRPDDTMVNASQDNPFALGIVLMSLRVQGEVPKQHGWVILENNCNTESIAIIKALKAFGNHVIVGRVLEEKFSVVYKNKDRKAYNKKNKVAMIDYPSSDMDDDDLDAPFEVDYCTFLVHWMASCPPGMDISLPAMGQMGESEMAYEEDE